MNDDAHDGGLTNGHAMESHVQQASSAEALQALDVIYNPSSTNDLRRQATVYLEQVKSTPDAAVSGFQLANAQYQPPHVRHYGLTVLEHVIRYRWQELSAQEMQDIRLWIIQLTRSVSADQPGFLHNKIAQVWVEIAKQCWTSEWDDMDRIMQALWDLGDPHKGVVLHILETLSEHSFSVKDPSGSGRDTDLGSACVAIFTEQRILEKATAARAASLSLRHGEDGWLKRLMEHLLVWLDSASTSSRTTDAALSLSLKTFAVLRSTMSWAMLRSVSNLQCVLVFCRYLSFPAAVEIQMVGFSVSNSVTSAD